jgi:hypothetical protein
LHSDKSSNVSSISSRHDLIRVLDSVISETSKSIAENQKFPENISKVKTYQIESNQNIEDIVFSSLINFKPLDDENLYKLVITNHKKEKPISLFIDTSNNRFWSVYCFNKSSDSDRRIKHLVNYTSNNLDHFWLPNSFLNNILGLGKVREISSIYEDEIKTGKNELDKKYRMRIWGEGAINISNIISNDPAYKSASSLAGVEVRYQREKDEDDSNHYFVDERISYDGKISVKGNSASLHFDFLNILKSDYQKLIEDIEKHRKSIFRNNNTTLEIHGTEFEFTIQKSIHDHKKLVTEFLSSKNALKIVGLPNKIAEDHYIVPGVDLHNGDKIDLEFYKNKIYLTLMDGGCGNTILRLLTNIQHIFDSSTIVETNSTNNTLKI